MNKNVRLIGNLFTHKILVIKLAVKELQSAKFYAVFLVSMTLIGIFSLSPGISSLINSFVIRGTGRIGIGVTAKSGSAQDIQAAVDEVAAMGGGNVYIPEGTFNFIDVGEPWETVYVPVGVNIFGAGMVDENLVFDETNQTDHWKTILKLPYEYPTGIGDEADQYEFFELSNPDKITDRGNRLSGFAIVGYRDELLEQGADPLTYPFPTFKAIKIFGVVDFRIDHLLIRNAGGGGVDVKNIYTPEQYGQGVIDHCKFINTAGWGHYYSTRTVCYGVAFRWSTSGTIDEQMQYWIDDISKVLGAYNRTVFIEDCYFQRWRHCVSSIAHAHYVFRYNRINFDSAWGSIDAHGSYGDKAGTRAIEVYNNTIENPLPYEIDPRTRDAMRIRGGGGVIFNNIIKDYDIGVALSGDAPTPEECLCHDIWIWDNTYENVDYPFSSSAMYQENVDYFLRAPNLEQDGFEYIPYPYPHPLTVEGG